MGTELSEMNRETMPIAPLFVGHTRFSIYSPNNSQWKASGGGVFADQSSYLRYLYAPERLDFRTMMFVEHSLKNLAEAAADHDIVHIVSYSWNLPSRYKSQLVDAADRYPFLMLNELAEGEQAPSWKELLGDRIPAGQYIGYYRLDDDDLISPGFFDQLAPYIKEPFSKMFVSFPVGFTAVWTGTSYVSPKITHQPLIAIGLTQVVRKNEDGTFDEPSGKGGHTRSDRHNAVILDGRVPAYFHTRSADQDTSAGSSKNVRIETLINALDKLGVADETDIEAHFPTLTELVSFTRVDSLVTERTTFDEPARFLFSEKLRKFTVSYDYFFAKALERAAYLMSFSLVDGRGEKAVLSEPIDDLSLSGNAEVGHFRYMPIRSGRNTGSLSVTLPEGVFCEGLIIREWKKKPENNLVLNSLRVQSEPMLDSEN